MRQRSPAAAHSGRQRVSQDSVDGKWVTGSGSSRAPAAGLSKSAGSHPHFRHNPGLIGIKTDLL